MMRYYCTYFDSNYLARALALYESLCRHSADFTLDALCLDAEAESLVSALHLPQVRVVRLSQLEQYEPRLCIARSNRTWIEYVWTLTPAVIQYSFTLHPGALQVTYLDADLYFYSSPEVVFSEIASSSISLIPHRFAREPLKNAEFNGRFNVGMMSFRRDTSGTEALTWWCERCLEACHASSQNGKFGDQKYLDDWPDRFRDVCVVQHPGANLAPWNVAAYPVHERRGEPWVNDYPVVFFHFHKLDILNLDFYHCGTRGISRRTANIVYRPYLSALQRAYEQLRTQKPYFSKGMTTVTLPGVLRWLRQRRLRFIYHPLG